MIVYFDTSALLKRYIVEAGSDAVATLWKQATESATSQILYAEGLASFARKRREQPGAADVLDEALRLFREDWMGLHRIDVDAEVNRFVDELLGRHPLRGLRDLVQGDVTFACADVALVNAARAEGFAIAP